MSSREEDGTEGPRLSRRSPLTPTRKLCPKCLVPLKTGNRLGGWLVPQDYYCPGCGYAGVVFLEEEIDVQHLEDGRG